MADRRHLSRLLSSFPDAEYDRIAPLLEQRELRQGQVLLTQGDAIDAVYFPESCVTSTVVTAPDGTTIEVGLMGYEGLVGLSLLMGAVRSNTTVVVQIPGTANCMSAVDFMEHIVRPHGESYTLLLRYIDVFMAMVAQTAACNSLHTIDQRLARWILMTHDRVRRADMPLTQEFIAYMLGVRRASVSIAAASLQSLSLIQYSRGHIKVLDRERLEEQSCPCYEIVRKLSDTLLDNQAA